MDALPVENVERRDSFREVNVHRMNAEGMRASLAVVRAAQEAARARNRRETLKTRILVGTAIVTVVGGLFVIRARGARAARSDAVPIAP